MAGCERGYLCTVCGQDVEEINESELYLRYVLGDVEWDTLNRAPERHIRCNPILAQFILDDAFSAVDVDGPFSKSQLDPEFVRMEEARVTAGYRRLNELKGANLPISEYPFPHVVATRASELPGSEA
jgi:hypothetical protein